MTNSKILWLRERFNWMGKHSGYDQVCDAIAKQHPDTYLNVWRELGKPLPRGSRYYLPKLMAGTKPSPFYNLYSASAESKVLWKSFLEKPELVHVTYVENNLGILPKWKEWLSFKLMGTVHQTAYWWQNFHQDPTILSSLNALIVLSRREVSYFEQYLPGRVHFIPHGVDTDFFYPSRIDENTIQNSELLRCVFSGFWQRDLKTLEQVIDKVLIQNSHIYFDMIVPLDRRNDPSLKNIACHNQIAWYAGISDEKLREIYRKASLIVLPMIDCTANNALLEAMACGLPVVCNDVGGLSDYTDSSFARLLPVGDVDGFVEEILKLTEDLDENRRRSSAARVFAEKNFSWMKIAEQTLTVYKNILD